MTDIGSAPDVTRCGRDDVSQVVDVLVESFFDYPVMRFVLGNDNDEYGRQLRALIHFFVMARVHRDETILGIGSPDRLEATALVSRPGVGSSPPELGELRERVWNDLGPSARDRYERFGEACTPFEVDTPHIHLNMIGVRRDAQGRGLGGRLVDAVHRLSADDPDSSGVSLTTEDERNVTLYEHLGYEAVGRVTVTPSLTSWGFFRTDR